MADKIRCIDWENNRMRCSRIAESGKEKKTWDDVWLIEVPDEASKVDVFYDGRIGFEIPESYSCKNIEGRVTCSKRRKR